MIDMVELDLEKLAPNLHKKTTRERAAELLNLIINNEEVIMTQYTLGFLCAIYHLDQTAIRNALARKGIAYNARRSIYVKKLIEKNPEMTKKHLEENYMIAHQVAGRVRKELGYE